MGRRRLSSSCPSRAAALLHASVCQLWLLQAGQALLNKVRVPSISIFSGCTALCCRYEEGCTAVAVATARGYLGLHLLATAAGAALPVWSESAPQCVCEELKIQAVRSQVWRYNIRHGCGTATQESSGLGCAVAPYPGRGTAVALPAASGFSSPPHLEAATALLYSVPAVVAVHAGWGCASWLGSAAALAT